MAQNTFKVTMVVNQRWWLKYAVYVCSALKIDSERVVDFLAWHGFERTISTPNGGN